MPRNSTTGVFTRVDNSFSEPVQGTVIDPNDAILLFNDYDTGLSYSSLTLTPRIVTVAGNVTVTNSDIFIALHKTVAADTDFHLPSYLTKVDPVTIWDADGVFNSHTQNVIPFGSETISGLTSYPMTEAFQNITFYPTSLGWMVGLI